MSHLASVLGNQWGQTLRARFWIHDSAMDYCQRPAKGHDSRVVRCEPLTLSPLQIDWGQCSFTDSGNACKKTWLSLSMDPNSRSPGLQKVGLLPAANHQSWCSHNPSPPLNTEDCQGRQQRWIGLNFCDSKAWHICHGLNKGCWSDRDLLHTTQISICSKPPLQQHIINLHKREQSHY